MRKESIVTKAKTSGGNTKGKKDNSEIMIVNEDPGVETRIAILENGRLEELYTERMRAATGVGNIYKGRVTNVESAIQAAFIEYGEQQRGFLHVTDLHPKYFPGKETSERVGKKIAKHNRPPLQKCLKKGDEVLVQVLKEGIGTKGPTLTSYLSMPGRLTVMMPFMDKVGVSRKIEDEDERKAMRKILDSLDLPEGFGFILRTAGMGKKKQEIKRDIAYLMRLWKMIEKRIKTVAAPCQLYNESDLLVRTIRDVLRPSIKAIVVDSDSSHERISSFLKIAAPRSSKKIIRYQEPTPIFHAFDVERQIDEVHSREVLLPSGGRLVIDQTEALVAIDVNSGKSRSAKNSESNALNTNLEAADEICRQLRLRDLGGIVINDLIDMGRASNRKKVEQSFQANLQRDRARSTVLPISRFGLLEMTRQRIRPSVLDSHYDGCTHCDGRGLVKSPEEVAADATRHCGWLLHLKNVKRVELTCSPSVGTYLLSNNRTELDNHEKRAKKRIVVRISEGIATDRVSYYAYDERGSDIDLTSIPEISVPTINELEASVRLGLDSEDLKEGTKPRRRSRRRGRSSSPIADAASIAIESDEESIQKTKSKPRKSNSRTSKNISKSNKRETPADSALRVYQIARKVGQTSKEIIEFCKAQGANVRGHMSTVPSELITLIQEKSPSDKTPSKKRRRGRGKRKNTSSDRRTSSKKSSNKSSKKKSTRRSTKKPQKQTQKTKGSKPKEVVEKKSPKPKPRRTLYGGRRRSVSTDEVQQSMVDRS